MANRPKECASFSAFIKADLALNGVLGIWRAGGQLKLEDFIPLI